MKIIVYKLFIVTVGVLRYNKYGKSQRTETDYLWITTISTVRAATLSRAVTRITADIRRRGHRILTRFMNTGRRKKE